MFHLQNKAGFDGKAERSFVVKAGVNFAETLASIAVRPERAGGTDTPFDQVSAPNAGRVLKVC
jgi:hypothetical protein